MVEMNKKRSWRWLKTAIGLLLVVSLLAAILPAPVQAEEKPEKVECRSYYRVKPGDTLYKISLKYNLYVKALVDANRMISPYTIYVGQSLCIPAHNVKVATVPKHAKKPAADYSAYVKGNKLFITTSNFPQDTVYYIRVKGDKSPGTVENKIGLLNTSGRSNFTDSFTLPKIYGTSKVFKICLKNVYTNVLVCRTALRK